MSLRGHKRKREGGEAHKAVRVCPHLSIMAQCAPDVLLLVLVPMNVSVIAQHVYCISIDVSNVGLTQRLTSYVSFLLTAEVDGVFRKNKLKRKEPKRKRHLFSAYFASICFVSLEVATQYHTKSF